MLSVTVPTPVRKVADRFKDLFSDTNLNYRCLCALFCMHLFGLPSLSAAVRSLGWTMSVSSLQRAVQSFDGNRFMRRLRQSILRKFEGQLNDDRFCYACDDTLNSKFGKLVFGNGVWGGACKGLHKGQRIMVIALIDKHTGTAFPIAYAFCKKKKDDNYKTGHDVAIELIDEILQAGFPILPIAMDSWFDCIEMMKKLEDRGFTFCIQAKPNRRVKNNPLPQTRWKKWWDLFSNVPKVSAFAAKTLNQKRERKPKPASTSRVFIRGRKEQLRAVAIFNHSNESIPFAVYLTNNFSLTCSDVWTLARRRWHIEEAFRELKQNLAFGLLPSTSKEGADLSVCLPFALWASLHLSPAEWGQMNASSETIGTRVKKIRELGLSQTLTTMLFNPEHNAVVHLKNRRQAGRINKKPVNYAAEDAKCRKSHAA